MIQRTKWGWVLRRLVISLFRFSCRIMCKCFSLTNVASSVITVRYDNCWKGIMDLLFAPRAMLLCIFVYILVLRSWFGVVAKLFRDTSLSHNVKNCSGYQIVASAQTRVPYALFIGGVEAGLGISLLPCLPMYIHMQIYVQIQIIDTSGRQIHPPLSSQDRGEGEDLGPTNWYTRK